MILTSGRHYNNVGEKPTVILDTTYINRHARDTSKTETKGTISLGTAQFCHIGSINRTGWMVSVSTTIILPYYY